MTHQLDDIWHSELYQPRRCARLPGDLATTRDRRRRQSPASASLAEIWELRTREAANAQCITRLERRVKELEGEHDFNAAGKPAGLSLEVKRLITGDFESDDTEDLMMAMHRNMAAGDRKLAYELVSVAAGIIAPDEIDARCLALETLATARLPSVESLLRPLIEFCIASDIERLQFRAIGAAGRLPQATRVELSAAVDEVVGKAAPGSSVRRLGTLFLENNR